MTGSSRPLVSRRMLAASASVVLLVGTLGASLVHADTPNQTYTACLKLGLVFNVAIGSQPSAPCPKGVVQISWNQTGQPGPAGLPGTPGSNGKDGAPGKSAYDIWLGLGNAGTPEDFVASLKGPTGAKGTDGASAYQTWLSLGNTGTEQDFIHSLQGPPGSDGADGTQALAGHACVQGEYVTGFDQSGSFVCGTAGAAVSRHIYWTNQSTGSIGRADMDGQNANQGFIAGLFGLTGSVATGPSHIYWTSFPLLVFNGSIGRADLDGQNVNQSIISGVPGLQGLAVDSGHIYWTSNGPGLIGRADLDGQNANQSFISGASGPSGVTVDSGQHRWTNCVTGSIGRADLNGQEREPELRRAARPAHQGGRRLPAMFTRVNRSLSSIGRSRS